MAAIASSEHHHPSESPVSRPQLWIVGAWQDLLLFIATPLLIIPIVELLKFRLSVEDISLYVVAFGATGHHLPGLLRAYGDRELFQRFRTRFILAPIFLLAVSLYFAFWKLEGLLVILLLWGFWHGLMQVYGFARIYDAKVNSTRTRTARIDLLMCIAWFSAGLLYSPGRMEQILRAYASTGAPRIPAPAIHLLQAVWGGLLVVVSLLFVANYLRQRFATGQTASPVKLLAMATSFGFWWYAMVGIDNVLLGIALFEVFHDVQYLSIVWLVSRKRAAQSNATGRLLTALFRGRSAMIGIYVGLVFAYGYLAFLPAALSAESVKLTLVGALAASALLHFYYDGFIWKIREAQTRQTLGLEGGQDQLAKRVVPTWLTHGLKWSCFVIPVAMIAVHEARRTPDSLLDALYVAEAVPTSWRARATLGLELAEAGRGEEAIIQYLSALELNPSDPEIHTDVANALRNAGQVEAAELHYLQSLELDLKLARTHSEYGKLLFMTARQPEAITHFEEATRLSPRDAEAHFELGRAQYERGDSPAAITALGAAISLAPELTKAYVLRGTAMGELGEYASAIADFDKAISLDDTMPSAYNGRGTCRLRLDQVDRAIDDYNEAIHRDGEFAKAYRNRAAAWHRKGDLGAAVQDYQTAIRLTPTDPRNFQSLAWLHATAASAEIRDGRSAKIAATRACELTNWKSPQALHTLAAAHAESGDYEEAIRWLRQALSLASPVDQATLEADLKTLEANRPLRDSGFTSRRP